MFFGVIMLPTELSQHVLQALPQLVTVYDRSQGRLIYLNRDPLGYAADDVLAMDDPTLISLFPSKEDAAMLWLRVQGIQSAMQIPDLQLRNSKGEWRLFSVHFSVCASNPDIVMGIWEDITERRQFEATLRENERAISQLKYQFTGHFSHEFRTPLSIIMVATELLRLYGDRLSDEKKMSQYSKISDSVQRVITLLNNLSADLGIPQTGV
jgi:PAS domain S-box-containing protein